jgi:CBS domain containing-hemolysin-like protein
VNLWIIRNLERIPAPGESFQIEGLEVKIERASRRRIHEVRIRRPSARTATDPGAGDGTAGSDQGDGSSPSPA